MNHFYDALNPVVNCHRCLRLGRLGHRRVQISLTWVRGKMNSFFWLYTYACSIVCQGLERSLSAIGRLAQVQRTHEGTDPSLCAIGLLVRPDWLRHKRRRGRGPCVGSRGGEPRLLNPTHPMNPNASTGAEHSCHGGVPARMLFCVLEIVHVHRASRVGDK